MENPYARELLTKDDVPLSELLDIAQQTIDLFNEAERPFREMLTQTVSEKTFRTSYEGDMTWERLAEGEHPRTGDMDNEQVAMNIEKYGRGLGFSQEFIEDNPSEMVTRRINAMVEGALNREHKVIFETFKQGIASGDPLWFDVPDYGDYTFSNDHDHTFGTTQELFGDSNPHTPTEHLRAANAEIRHHGKTPAYTLVSSEFAAQFVDELAWEASYHIPDVTNLRSTALPDASIVIDGTNLVQTPWLNDEGASDYTFYVMDGSKPIYFHEARPVQLTAPGGAPIRSPGDLIGATGSARYGCRMINPLAGVKVTADTLA